MEFASRRTALVALVAVSAAIACGAGGCRRHRPRPPSTRPAAVAGQLVSAAGLSLEGAVVEAAPARDDSEDELREPLATVPAGADGAFRIPDLPPGRYVLRARAARHATARTFVVARPGGVARPLLTLERGEALRGQVLDARGAAVPGARVLLLPPYHAPPAEAVTDAEGRFAVDQLGRGDYRLLVEAPGFASAERAAVPVPGAAVAIRLGGQGQTVSGRALAAGAPAAGARVRLGGEDAAAARETVARPDGTFVFGGLGAGTYAARATRGALASPTVAGIVVEPAAGPAGRAGRPPREPVRLELAPGTLVVGRVVDDTGAAVAEATARAETAADDPLPELAPADRNGSFRLGPLPPGEYRVLARRAGYVARRTVAVRLAASAPPPAPLTLELVRGAALIGRVTDARGRGAGGALVRCLAAGIEDLTVLTEPLPLAAEAAALPPGAGRALGTTRAVRADAAGRFQLADLVPGRFYLEASRAGSVPLRTAELALAPGQRRDVGALALRDGIPVSGRVSDDAGTPVANARVAVRARSGAAPSARDVESGQVAVTDGGGHFTLALAPGRYTLAVSAPDLSERALPVDVADGQNPAPLEIALARADGTLEGLAKDEGGRPVARARVAAWSDEPGTGASPDDHAPLGSAVTDAGGHFTIGRVPRRALVVEVRHPDYPPTTQPATPGTLAVVTLPIPGGVDGEVRERGTGAVVARTRVEAVGPAGRSATATSGRGGAFKLLRLAPGRWRLTASAPGFRSAEREVDVPPSSILGEPSVRDLRVELEAAR